MVTTFSASCLFCSHIITIVIDEFLLSSHVRPTRWGRILSERNTLHISARLPNGLHSYHNLDVYIPYRCHVNLPPCFWWWYDDRNLPSLYKAPGSRRHGTPHAATDLAETPTTSRNKAVWPGFVTRPCSPDRFKYKCIRSFFPGRSFTGIIHAVSPVEHHKIRSICDLTCSLPINDPLKLGIEPADTFWLWPDPLVWHVRPDGIRHHPGESFHGHCAHIGMCPSLLSSTRFGYVTAIS